MIGEKERYHGVALCRIVASAMENISIRAYVDEARSAYIVNDQSLLYIKYSTNRLTPWPFVFGESEVGRINDFRAQFDRVELVLVCGSDGIVSFNYAEIADVLEAGKIASFSLQVKRRRRQSYRVTGIWKGEMVVPDAAFPRTFLDWLAAQG